MYLEFEPKHLELTCCVDASHLFHKDGKGHFGFCIQLGESIIYSKSKKISMITLSSTESELVGAHEGIQYVMYIERLLKELGINVKTPIIYQDNKSTIHLLKQGSNSLKNKHINVKFFFAKELINQNQIKVEYLPTTQMVADGLTKMLNGIKLVNFTHQILNKGDFMMQMKV